MQAKIVAKGLTFEWPNGALLFHNLNFTLPERLTALVGQNGVGKSALARLLSGELEPTRGQIFRQKGVYHFQQLEKPPLGVSVGDYLRTRCGRPRQCSDLLEKIDSSQLCNMLSGGEWMRVRLAAIHADRFLILDEPSNNLDSSGRQALCRFLKEYPHGLLLISHDREMLSLCENTLELSSQGLRSYGMNFESYLELRQMELHKAEEKLDRSQRERDQMSRRRVDLVEAQKKRSIRASRRGYSTGLDKRIRSDRKRRAEVTAGSVDNRTMAKLTEKVSSSAQAFLELRRDKVMYADLLSEPLHPQAMIAEACDFNIKFGGEWLYRQNLNFSWRGNIRMAIRGRNGSGKTTLLKAILGQAEASQGGIRAGRVASFYLDQKVSGLNDELTILQNLQTVSGVDEIQLRNGLARFLFFGDEVFKPVGALSGGERIRAALACAFLQPSKPQWIVLDEPTNNLDLANIEFLESFVSRFRGPVIAVSHDETFLRGCKIDSDFDLD